MRETDGIATASMVIGIVAAVLFWVPLLGFVLGVPALVFGIIGVRRAVSVGQAVAGVCCGACALAFQLFIVALLFVEG